MLPQTHALRVPRENRRGVAYRRDNEERLPRSPNLGGSHRTESIAALQGPAAAPPGLGRGDGAVGCCRGAGMGRQMAPWLHPGCP